MTSSQVTSFKRSKASRQRALKRNLKGWLITMWPFIGYLIFGIIPFALSLYLSWTDLKGYDLSTTTWVGISNFKNLMNDRIFWISLRQTAYFTLSVPLSMALGLLIAVLISQHIKGKRFFRTIFFIPYVCSVVAVALVWKWIYRGDYGVINTFLKSIGLNSISFLGNKNWFMPATIFMTLLSGIGYQVFLYQSAIGNVNENMIEAAKIDGASNSKIFFKITLPSISPTTFYLLIMRLIGALQVMSSLQILASDGAGPSYAAYSTVYYLYDMAFTYTLTAGMGMASAAAWILTIIILILTFVNFKLQKYWVHYMD